MDGAREYNGLNGWMGGWVVKGSITRQTVTRYRDNTGQNDTMYEPYCSLWPPCDKLCIAHHDASTIEHGGG